MKVLLILFSLVCTLGHAQLASVRINELDPDTQGPDTFEFIELYGSPNLPLDGLVLVLFDGVSETAYGTYDLAGYSLNESGFFLLGQTGFSNPDMYLSGSIQNGTDAIALYSGSANDWPQGALATSNNLIDALVYSSGDAPADGLISILAPGQIFLDDFGNSPLSFSRIPDGGEAFNHSTYSLLTPTPGLSNGTFSISLQTGNDQQCTGDNNQIVMSDNTTIYLITDTNNRIITWFEDNAFNLNQISSGVYRIHGLNYIDTIAEGALNPGESIENISSTGTSILSSNYIEIVRVPCDITISATGPLAGNSPNTSITFSANNVNLEGSISYQWYKNDIPVGSNSPTYTNGNWINGEKIVCRATNSFGYSIYSNDLFVSLAQTTQDQWQRVADVGLDKNLVVAKFPTRIGGICFSIGQKIYFGLGYNHPDGFPPIPGDGYQSDFWEYNTVTDEWTERAPFAFGTSPRMNAIAFVVNGKGYVGFGQGNEIYYNDLWEYDPQTNSWTQKSSCPAPGRHSAVSTSLDNYGFVGTGWGLNTYFSDWWKYSPLDDSWSQLTDFPLSVFGYSCAGVNNKIYVFGGQSNLTEFIVGSNFEYDPVNNSWTEKASGPGYLYSKSFVINDSIYAVGGQLTSTGLINFTDEPCTGMTTSSEVWAYSPKTNSWIQKSDIIFGKISNGGATSADGYGYYIGGGAFQACQTFINAYYNNGNQGRVLNLRYNATADNWQVMASHGGVRSYFGFSTNIGDKGYALFQFRGFTSNEPILSELYLYEYDAINNTWRQKSKYPGLGNYQPGNGFTINGKIYYGSGSSSNGVLVNDFWEYDPLSNTWENAGTVPIASNKGYSFTLNGKGYIGGAELGTSLFEFNASTMTWSPRANMPGYPGGNINFSINNMGYTSSINSANSGSLYKYDPSINIWSLVGPLPYIDASISSAYFSFSTFQKGYYGTGISSIDLPTTSSMIYEFNPSNNQWSQKASLPENHLGAGSFSFSQLPCVFAGQQYFTASPGNYVPINSTWQYKPECSINYSTLEASSCDSFTINGQTFTNSGVFIQNLNNTAGCDSILTINLTINHPTNTETNVSACNFYNWYGQSYTNSGIYSHSLVNSAGCDSIVTINLEINSAPSSEVVIGETSITAVESNAIYQWIDCDNNFTAIPGASNQTLQVTNPGNYALIISNGQCADTSSCFTFATLIAENTVKPNYKIYPNPAHSFITIQAEGLFGTANYRILDAIGAVVDSGLLSNAKQQMLDISSWANGFYMLQVQGAQAIAFVKE